MAFLSTPDLCIWRKKKTWYDCYQKNKKGSVFHPPKKKKKKKALTLASLPMTRSLSSMILSLMEDLYLFSMMLWVVLLSPSFTTPPCPIPPLTIWPWSMLVLGPFVQLVEPGCSCLIGSLSPPPIITGTVVRMLLLISVWGQEPVVSH